jgi:hypothetical protein
MRAQNAENWLHLSFRSLDTGEQLSDVKETMQILLAAGMVRVLNRLEDGLEEVHGRICLCRAAGG